jgi:hypothetical protein
MIRATLPGGRGFGNRLDVPNRSLAVAARNDTAWIPSRDRQGAVAEYITEASLPCEI